MKEEPKSACCDKCSGVVRDENSFGRDYGCLKDECSCHKPLVPASEKECKHDNDDPKKCTFCINWKMSQPSPDWMGYEREAFSSKWADETGFVSNESDDIADYWLSRIASKIEEARKRGFREGQLGMPRITQSAHDSGKRIGREQGIQEERERVVKMIEILIENWNRRASEDSGYINGLKDLLTNLKENE